MDRNRIEYVASWIVVGGFLLLLLACTLIAATHHVDWLTRYTR